VPLPQLSSESPHFLLQGLTLSNSVVAHQKSFLYTSNIVNIASQLTWPHVPPIYYADDSQPYVKLYGKNLENIKIKIAACVHNIQFWCASMCLELNATKTELILFDRQCRLDDDKKTKNLNLDPQCCIPLKI